MLFRSSFDDVRDLLPAFFAGDWNATKVVESTHQQYDSRDSLAMMCDFSMAFSALNDAQKDILNRKYGQDEELTESKDRQAASRALKKFTLTLNTATDKRAKAHEGPGSRKAISSSNGVYKAKGDYVDCAHDSPNRRPRISTN